jgi:hypothetical protein
MPSSFTNVAVARAVGKLPLVRNLPVARLVVLAEVAILAKDHIERLEPAERRKLVVLLRDAKGRPGNLSDRQRRELESLVAKLEPKLFASKAIDRFSPFPTRRRRS